VPRSRLAFVTDRGRGHRHGGGPIIGLRSKLVAAYSTPAAIGNQRSFRQRRRTELTSFLRSEVELEDGLENRLASSIRANPSGEPALANVGRTTPVHERANAVLAVANRLELEP
jgi:hypothetical protein